MRNLTTLTLALAAGVAAVPAIAADGNLTPLSPEAIKAHEAAVAADAAQRSKRARAAAPSKDGASLKAAKASTYPGTPHANGFRTYPPSCAADPLPDQPSGRILAEARVPLIARDNNTADMVGLEDVTLTVWRLACSSSGELTPYNGDNGYNSMTLMRIERDSNASPNYYVTFPQITVSQQGSPFDDASRLRAAAEPNTVIADTPLDAAIPDAVTFALENYPYQGSRAFFFNYQFTLRVDPLASTSAVDIQIPGYDPNEADYPDAFNPLPFDGYAAAQWTGKTRPTDGLLMQVTEQWSGSGDNATWSRQIVFDLLTRDQNGNPFWLVGSAPFNEGDISVTSDVFYLGNGGATPGWGKATFTFPHCNLLNVTFTPNGGLPAPVPSISGTTEYNRLFSANGMMCE